MWRRVCDALRDLECAARGAQEILTMTEQMKSRQTLLEESICAAVDAFINQHGSLTVMETLTALEHIRHVITESYLRQTMGENYNGP
jgi:hypothetical protein